MNPFLCLALVGSVCGAFLVSNLSKHGYTLWLGSNIVYFLDSMLSGSFEYMMLWGFYCGTCVIGYKKLSEVKE